MKVKKPETVTESSLFIYPVHSTQEWFLFSFFDWGVVREGAGNMLKQSLAREKIMSQILVSTERVII